MLTRKAQLSKQQCRDQRQYAQSIRMMSPLAMGSIGLGRQYTSSYPTAARSLVCRAVGAHAFLPAHSAHQPDGFLQTVSRRPCCREAPRMGSSCLTLFEACMERPPSCGPRLCSQARSLIWGLEVRLTIRRNVADFSVHALLDARIRHHILVHRYGRDSCVATLHSSSESACDFSTAGRS